MSRNHNVLNLITRSSLFFLLCAGLQLFAQSSDAISFIRINTVGYLSGDEKIAIIGSQDNLEGKPFYLIEPDQPKKIVYTGKISASRGNEDTPFKYNFPCDFSNFKRKESIN